jgi:hypothetical protein
VNGTVMPVGVKIGVATHLAIRDGSNAPLAETIVTLGNDNLPVSLLYAKEREEGMGNDCLPKPFFSCIPEKTSKEPLSSGKTSPNSLFVSVSTSSKELSFSVLCKLKDKMLVIHAIFEGEKNIRRGVELC